MVRPPSPVWNHHLVEPDLSPTAFAFPEGDLYDGGDWKYEMCDQEDLARVLPRELAVGLKVDSNKEKERDVRVIGAGTGDGVREEMILDESEQPRGGSITPTRMPASTTPTRPPPAHLSYITASSTSTAVPSLPSSITKRAIKPIPSRSSLAIKDDMAPLIHPYIREQSGTPTRDEREGMNQRTGKRQLKKSGSGAVDWESVLGGLEEMGGNRQKTRAIPDTPRKFQPEPPTPPRPKPFLYDPRQPFIHTDLAPIIGESPTAENTMDSEDASMHTADITGAPSERSYIPSGGVGLQREAEGLGPPPTLQGKRKTAPKETTSARNIRMDDVRAQTNDPDSWECLNPRSFQIAKWAATGGANEVDIDAGRPNPTLETMLRAGGWMFRHQSVGGDLWDIREYSISTTPGTSSPLQVQHLIPLHAKALNLALRLANEIPDPYLQPLTSAQTKTLTQVLTEVHPGDGSYDQARNALEEALVWFKEGNERVRSQEVQGKVVLSVTEVGIGQLDDDLDAMLKRLGELDEAWLGAYMGALVNNLDERWNEDTSFGKASTWTFKKDATWIRPICQLSWMIRRLQLQPTHLSPSAHKAFIIYSVPVVIELVKLIGIGAIDRNLHLVQLMIVARINSWLSACFRREWWGGIVRDQVEACINLVLHSFHAMAYSTRPSSSGDGFEGDMEKRLIRGKMREMMSRELSGGRCVIRGCRIDWDRDPEVSTHHYLSRRCNDIISSGLPFSTHETSPCQSDLWKREQVYNEGLVWSTLPVIAIVCTVCHDRYRGKAKPMGGWTRLVKDSLAEVGQKVKMMLWDWVGW